MKQFSAILKAVPAESALTPLNDGYCLDCALPTPVSLSKPEKVVLFHDPGKIDSGQNH